MTVRKIRLKPRTVQSDSGGIIENGAFQVKVPIFGFKLTYREAGRKLSLPFEVGLDHSLSIGTALIDHWDGLNEIFTPHQKTAIERNIFDALDCLGIRYTNAR